MERRAHERNERFDTKLPALERLAADVEALVAQLRALRGEVAALQALHRPLSPPEADAERDLRWRADVLRGQLAVLRDQFEQVRRVWRHRGG
jgi:hypothetical protein